MHRIYETLIAPNGSYLACDVHFISNKENHKTMLENSGMVTLEGNKIVYTTEPLYLDYEQQKSLVFHIVNANNLSTYYQFWSCLKEHYKEYLNIINNNAVIDMLKWMYQARINDERVYPQVKLPIIIQSNK